MANTAPKKASPTDWHPADIKAALEKKGWTLRALAAHHGIKGSSSLSHTFERSFPLNEKRIADALGVPVQEIDHQVNPVTRTRRCGCCQWPD